VNYYIYTIFIFIIQLLFPYLLRTVDLSGMWLPHGDGVLSRCFISLCKFLKKLLDSHVHIEILLDDKSIFP
jgi:hypothetical protein